MARQMFGNSKNWSSNLPLRREKSPWNLTGPGVKVSRLKLVLTKGGIMPHNRDASSVPNENDPLDLERIDRQIRINRLQEEIKKVTGEEALFGQSPDCPPEVVERFLKQVLEIERAQSTTQLELLARQGIHLPSPDELDDAHLHDKLWELIRGLEKQNTFLYHTNHLSDRE